MHVKSNSRVDITHIPSDETSDTSATLAVSQACNLIMLGKPRCTAILTDIWTSALHWRNKMIEPHLPYRSHRAYFSHDDFTCPRLTARVGAHISFERCNLYSVLPSSS